MAQEERELKQVPPPPPIPVPDDGGGGGGGGGGSSPPSGGGSSGGSSGSSSGGSSSGGSSAPAAPAKPAGQLQIEANFRSMYIQLWGTAPPPNYVEGMSKKMNLFEFELQERSKPAFRNTRTYRDESRQYMALLG